LYFVKDTQETLTYRRFRSESPKKVTSKYFVSFIASFEDAFNLIEIAFWVSICELFNPIKNAALPQRIITMKVLVTDRSRPM